MISRVQSWISSSWSQTIYIQNLTTNLWQVNHEMILTNRFSKLSDAELVELILTETAVCDNFYLDPQVVSLDPRLAALAVAQELER